MPLITSSYGSWKSPITAELVAGGEIGLEQVRIDDDKIYWIERRPQEGGRKVIVRRSTDGNLSDVTPAGFNARTRMHEYGGGDYGVANGTILFSNFADQRLYRQDLGSGPKPVTPQGPFRYADGQIDRRRNLFYCVREDHTGGGEAINTLVRIDLSGGDTAVIVAGNDFYSSPRLSLDGSGLAWLTWNHPNMPWDGTELWFGKLTADGSIVEKQKIAGGDHESICQPEWSPAGELYFVSDRTGWWNLYRYRQNEIEALCPMPAEFGQPHWVFGTRLYDFASEKTIVCSYAKDGRDYVATLGIETKTLKPIETPFTAISQIHCAGDRVIFIGASPRLSSSIVSYHLHTRDFEILRRSRKSEVDASFIISEPQPIQFPTENGLTAYGYFYRPRNPEHTAPQNENPPLVVMSHGGPTSSSSASLKYAIQYWTSRGIAVLDVNYGGSSGYGRAYRERLNGQWGIVDVDDCVNGARYLVDCGEVDGNRLAIRGGSAGGYTTLCALTFRSSFTAGASHYGVSDLEALAKDTHKFESRYLDRLIGPYPERRDLYLERSPIHFTERLNCPMILFQGLEDKVVPPDQSEKMFQAARAKKLPVAYLTFEGEQHGFRKAENIKRVLEAELYFYGKIFRFEPADPIEPVHIENL
jgi:dipeptidyl aminopeptidase/acylaminoacyl peptidase